MLSLLLVPLGHHDNGKEKKLEMDGLRLLKLAAAPKTFSQKSKKHRKTEQKSRNYHPCVCGETKVNDSSPKRSGNLRNLVLSFQEISNS